MWFGVLGALEVRDAHGSERPLVGPLRRQLLAALLCRAGRPVPAAGLVDDLWGDVPPRAAAKALQSHMVRLRDDLGRDGESVVRTEFGGYRLDLGTARIDAVEFEQLVARAGDSTDGSAAADLEAALALWRGDAYLEFGDAAFAVAERQRLAELRSSARERLTDIALSMGRAGELVADLEARVAAEPFRERTWEQLIIALYRSGRQGDALGAYRRVRELLAADLGVDPGPALRDLETRVLHQDATLLVDASPPVAVAGATGGCPYRGLSGYGDRDAAVFVGRERLTAELAGLLAEHRVVVVTGPSGSGKSSLLNAGLLPSLRAGGLPGSASWRCGVLKPTAMTDSRTALPADLLIVDQAEELFTVLDADDRRAAAARIALHVADGGALVLAIRGDFFDRLAGLDPLAGYPRTTLLARPMRDDEIRRAVVEPAVRAGLTLEPELVETVLDEVSGRPGALPLLSVAMTRTWGNRSEDVLTLAGYRAGGGIAGALEAGAEDSYAALPGPLRGPARHVLLRLATKGPAGWVRRPLRRGDIAPGPESDALAALVRDRLAVADGDRIELVHEAVLTSWPRLRGWLDEREHAADLLDHLTASARAWDAAGRPAADLYRGTRLRPALDWAEAHPQDIAALEDQFLRASAAAADAELDAARARADREAAGRRRLRVVVALLAAVAIAALVAVGVALHERSQSRTQALRADTAALTADARRLAAQALSAGDLRTSLLLSVAAYRLDPSPETRSALLATLQRTGSALWRLSTAQRVQWLAASADGTRLWASDNQGRVLRYDTASRHLLGSFAYHGGRVQALSPDGRLLVVSGSDGSDPTLQGGTVRVLDATTGAGRRTLPTPTPDGGAGWHTAAFTTDGRHLVVLAAARPDGQQPAAAVDVYDASDLQRPPRVLRLDAPGTRLATGRSTFAVSTSSGTIEIVAARTLRVLHRARRTALAGPAAQGDGGGVAALSPDGSRLVVATALDAALRVLDARALTRPGRELTQPSDGVVELAFSPSGHQLALGGAEGSVTVLSSATGRATHDLAGDTGEVLGLGWAARAGAPAADASLFSGGLDSQIVSWDLATGSRLVRVVGPARPKSAFGVAGRSLVGVSPLPRSYGGSTPSQDLELEHVDLASGRTLLRPLHLAASDTVQGVGTDATGTTVLVSSSTASGVTHLDLWNALTGRRLHRLDTSTGPGAAGVGAVDGTGRLAAVATGAERIALYRLPGFRPVRSFPVEVPDAPQRRYVTVPLAFDPSGDLIVLDIEPGGSRDHRLVSIDPRTGATTGTADLGPGGDVQSVTFSPDRTRVLTGDTSGRISLFDVRTLRPVVRNVVAAAGYVFNASFSPDGRTIATTGSDSTVRLFDAATLMPIGAPIVLPGQDWVFGGFDGRDEVAGLGPGDGPGTQRRFVVPVAPRSWISTACGIAGGGLTRAEWRQLIGDRPYLPLCPTH